MTDQELHELEKEIAIIETRLSNIEKELSQHRRDFKEFKDEDFKDYQYKLELEKGKYFDILLAKETFKQWVDAAFSPVQKIVWGIVGLVLGGALVAGLAFLFKKPGP